MSVLPVVELTRERSSAHPWIFARMVRKSRRPLPAGTLVEVRARSGAFVGRGIYHPENTIALRLLTERPEEEIDEAFFAARLAEAKKLREEILDLPAVTDSYRLVNAEGDGLSGLIVDKFADVIVIAPQSAGYLVAGRWVAEALRALYPGVRIAVRPDERAERRERVTFADLARTWPCPDSASVREHAIRMKVDLRAGHKTGYFLDQRETRAAVAALARGREVLDLCCYTGGFAISAMKGGAASCTAVDLDEEALATARENARINGVTVDFRYENAFDRLRSLAAAGRQVDLVICDPAKLAGVKEEVPRAMATYGDLNRLAAAVVRPGGILVTSSCSGLLEPDTFLSIVRRSMHEAGRRLQIFRIAGAAPDHPVRSDFPEGRYLKVLFGRVSVGRQTRSDGSDLEE